MNRNTSIPSASTKPLLIAGPCSAETEEQVMATATALAAAGTVDVFRAGIWKPRTRPGSFEGVGTVGLQWLQRVKQETGLKTSTEVATAKHVEEALKHGIDVLWIGARTTANPFAVQEVADALAGVDIPIWVKNPVNPDADLWAGAIERIAKAGIQTIGGIHRGFSTYETKEYRNAPIWALPLELKRRFPNLSVICDPSHMGGTRASIAPLSKQALDMGFDGLIIETHPEPDTAWSDAKQQITPAALHALWAELMCAQPEDSACQLGALRAQIDLFDDQLLQILGQRMKLACEIGEIKHRNGQPVYQPERWNAVLNRMVSQANQHNLSEAVIYQVFNAIHQESVKKQGQIAEAQQQAGKGKAA